MANCIPMLIACGRNQSPRLHGGPECSCGWPATDLFMGEPICQDCHETRIARLMSRRDT